jgi:hypothetical protein
VILHPHFTRSIVVRSLVAWGFLRLLVLAGSGAAAALAGRAPPPDPWLLTVRAALALVVAVTAVGWRWARHRNEDLFLPSLGYGRGRVLALVALPPALLELALGVAMRA